MKIGHHALLILAMPLFMQQAHGANAESNPLAGPGAQTDQAAQGPRPAPTARAMFFTNPSELREELAIHEILPRLYACAQCEGCSSYGKQGGSATGLLYTSDLNQSYKLKKLINDAQAGDPTLHSSEVGGTGAFMSLQKNRCSIDFEGDRGFRLERSAGLPDSPETQFGPETTCRSGPHAAASLEYLHGIFGNNASDRDLVTAGFLLRW
jgi:hypothetical protein